MSRSETASSTSTNPADAEHQGQSGTNVDVGAAMSEASEQIQQQVSGLTGQVRQQATDLLASRKEQLVDTLDTVALLLHQAGEHAELQDKVTLSNYVDNASGQLNQWSSHLREREVTDLLDDTVQFARRQPMVFFSGALATGFAAARFFRTSAKQPTEQTAASTADQTGTMADQTATTAELGASDAPRFDTVQEAFESVSSNGSLDELEGSSLAMQDADTTMFIDEELELLEGFDIDESTTPVDRS